MVKNRNKNKEKKNEEVIEQEDAEGVVEEKEDKQEYKKDDVKENLDPEEDYSKLSVEDRKKLIFQVQAEYRYCRDYVKPRMDESLVRLKLYNNQRRDKKAVGDPLLFTGHSTLLASLYDDRISVKWKPNEMGDITTATNLSVVSEYDYSAMNKPLLDYYQIWDALFFGYGVIDLSNFNRKKMLPVPRVVDPMAWFYDPKGSNINPDEDNLGGMRFLGEEILYTKNEMKESGLYFNLEDVKCSETMDSATAYARQQREDALGVNSSLTGGEDLGDNEYLALLQWKTTFKGKKVLVTLANERELIVRFKYLKADNWEYIAKRAWITPHQFPGVSIPDMVEDKQRMRAVLINLMVLALKSDIKPMYIYNSQAIKNVADLKFGIDRWIAAKGNPETAAIPLQKASPNMGMFSYIYDTLDIGVQKAIASPEIQQGIVSKESRTLGELNLVADKVSTRYSLMVKNMNMGETEFWKLWYQAYKNNMEKDLGEKIVRITGQGEDKFRPFTKENLIAKTDPDVEVVSKVLLDAKKQRLLTKYVNAMQVAMSDPEANKRYILRKFLELSELEEQEINAMLPLTPEEMIAKDQNESLNRNEIVDVLPSDDHRTHIFIHREANVNEASLAHIYTHRKYLKEARKNPEVFPDQAGQQPVDTMNAQTMMGGQTMQQGVPSKEAAQTNLLTR